jgi:thioredoxin reductase (NADPH)
MITAELLRASSLFVNLAEGELVGIAARAADVQLGEGDWLIHEGQLPAFFVLLDGQLAVMKSFGGVDTQINQYEEGDFFGELPLLLGSAAVAGLQALTQCRVARFDEHDFREVIVSSTSLSGAVMRAMAERVHHLGQLGAEAPSAAVTVVGRGLDPRCHDVRDFLARNGATYLWLDPDDENGAAQIATQSVPLDQLPLVILPDGSRLAAPDFRTLADFVGLHTTPARDIYDVVIVGGGPAGLAAAVYGASEGLSTLLIERTAPGGQAGTSSRIENYLGFPSGLSGDDLSSRARQQAERFGAEIVVARAAQSLVPAGAGSESHRLRLDDNTEVSARAVVLAMGVEWRRLGIAGVERFTGRGLFYGAARTEALSMRGKHVHIIGGGNSAGQAAAMFSDYADTVTLLVRGSSLASSMSSYLSQQLDSKANIRVEVDTEIIGCNGEQTLLALTLRNRASGIEREVESDGLFVFIGATAETAWLDDGVQRDRLGFICTGSAVHNEQWLLERDPMLLETSIPGVFAAGDARSGSIKRVASSVGEGSMAIAFVHQHLAT